MVDDGWLLIGEEATVYGLYQTELDAWDAAAESAATCFIECIDDDHRPHPGESVDDWRTIRFHWTIATTSGAQPKRVELTARRFEYDQPFGYYVVEQFPLPGWLRPNATTPPPGSSRICPDCGRPFETSGAVEVHLGRDHGEGSSTCPACGFVYATEEGRDRHVRKKHPDMAAEQPARCCGLCRREFASPADARAHETALHANGVDAVGTVECPDCGWVFTPGRGYLHHRAMKHGAEPEPEPEAPPEAPPELEPEPPPVPEPEPAPDPEPEPARAPVRAGPPKVWCGDCGEDFLYADDLNNHTLSEHRRRATPLERTPSREPRA